MKKLVSLLSLMLIIGLGTITAQTNTRKDSTNYKINLQKMQQASLKWYQSTDSLMQIMNRTQWDSTMNSMTIAQRDGITEYRSKMLKEKTQQQNRLNNDSTAKTSNDSIADASSNNNSTINATNTKDSTKSEADFILKAAEIIKEEIKLGKLAQEKGTATHIKELGKMMYTEHTQALAELTTLAKTKMVNIPTNESEKVMDAYKKLEGKTGSDFDNAYSDLMVKGHKEAIALFETHNQKTKDADVKKLTNDMISKLKSHLEHSEKCRKEITKL